MKIPLLCCLLLCGANLAFPQERTAATPAPAPAATVVLPRKPTYKPPKVGAPAVRVAGGSRGGDFDGVVLQALVPDHVARTFEAAPSLYWFQSKPAQARFTVSITAPGQARSILERHGDGAQTAGIHRLNLAAEKDAEGKPIELKPGIAYKWVVALVPDATSRSKDIIASGMIERLAPDAEMQARMEKAAPAERACLLAESGVWYDAFGLISKLSAENPRDAALRTARAELLAGIGLDQAAAAARR